MLAISKKYLAVTLYTPSGRVRDCLVIKLYEPRYFITTKTAPVMYRRDVPILHLRFMKNDVGRKNY